MDKTVLIVACPETQNELAPMLAAEGCVPGNASTLDGALYILDQFKHMDCMLLEENNTGISMDEFLSRVNAKCPAIYIVAITEPNKLPEWAQVFAVSHFLVKPFVASELRKVLSGCRSESGTELTRP